MTFPLRGNSSRTAHHGKTARIEYRYHPLFGREVQVVRRYPREGADGVLIALPDGSHCVIPGWMLQAATCACLVDAPTPRISIDALLDLRSVLDSQSTPADSAADDGDASRAEEGDDHADSADSDASPALVPLGGVRTGRKRGGGKAGRVSPSAGATSRSGRRSGTTQPKRTRSKEDRQ